MPLSYSQIQLYRRCPRQYEFAVVKKIGRSITPGEGFGSSVHIALKKWGELEMAASGKRVADSPQAELFSVEEPQLQNAPGNALTVNRLLDFWHQSFIVDAFTTRMEADFARKRGEKVMEQFFAWWSKRPREVLAIEKSFSIAVDDVTMAGRFDRVEKTENGIIVIDFKTSAVRTQDEVDSDLQLSLYAMAVEQTFHQPCAELSLLFVDEDHLVERVTHRSQGQLQDARKQLLAVRGQIESGDFHPTPTAPKCRWCPYKDICDAAAVR